MGCKGSSAVAIDSLIQHFHERLGTWAVVFVPELDSLGDIQFSYTNSEVLVIRHWPGFGSFSMAWFVRASYLNSLVAVNWHGRAGSLLFRTAGRGNFLVTGLHGAHGDDFVDSLCDASWLLKKVSRGTSKFMVGDFNCDQLPFLDRPVG